MAYSGAPQTGAAVSFGLQVVTANNYSGAPQTGAAISFNLDVLAVDEARWGPSLVELIQRSPFRWPRVM